MNDVMVSIRLPAKLLSEIKSLVENGYYMDISEAIRCIVRDKWISYKQPEIAEIQKLRQNIEEELKKKSEKIMRMEMITELEKIKKLIVGEKQK